MSVASLDGLLLRATFPTQVLTRAIDLLGMIGLGPRVATKVDKLHAIVPSKRPLGHSIIARHQQLHLCTITAVKRPMCRASIEGLLSKFNLVTGFRSLCSVLISVMSRDRPVQIADQSLRDYVVLRAREAYS
jgi:hypothetical protein